MQNWYFCSSGTNNLTCITLQNQAEEVISTSTKISMPQTCRGGNASGHCAVSQVRGLYSDRRLIYDLEATLFACSLARSWAGAWQTNPYPRWQLRDTLYSGATLTHK
jgi:hypothetical protein